MKEDKLIEIWNKHSLKEESGQQRNTILSAMKEAMREEAQDFGFYIRQFYYVDSNDGTWRHRKDETIKIYTQELLYNEYLKQK